MRVYLSTDAGFEDCSNFGVYLTHLPTTKGLEDRQSAAKWTDLFFQFEYARVRLPLGIVNNIHSCLLHLNPTWLFKTFKCVQIKIHREARFRNGSFYLKTYLKVFDF